MQRRPAFRLVDINGTREVRTEDGRSVETVVEQMVGDSRDIIIRGPWPAQRADANPWASPPNVVEQYQLVVTDPQRARRLAIAAGVDLATIWW